MSLVQVAAVVVTFFPDDGFSANLCAISQEFCHVFIVDNSTAGACIEQYESRNVTILRMPVNVGVAAALNYGVIAASKKGYKYVALFDQDSAPRLGFSLILESLIRDVNSFAVIGSLYGSDDFLDSYRGSAQHFAVKTVITSGSMIDVDVWSALGGFREDLFIDYIDHDYCIRARKQGFGVFVAPAARLRHMLGCPKKHFFFGKAFFSSGHRSFRYYYMFRNIILIWRTSFWADPQWFVSMAFIHLPKMFIKAIIYDGSPLRKIGFALRGIFDGMRSNSGPYP